MGASVDHIALHARLTPNRIAAEDLTHGRRLSFADCDAQIGRYCATLAARGVKVGDRVATLARNRIELPLLHFACARVGAIYAPLNWRLAKAELHALVEDADPTLLLGDAALLASDLAGEDIVEFDAKASELEPVRSYILAAAHPSLLLYTSGTSGRAKGVLLSEQNLLQTAINYSLLGRVTHKSVFLCDAPMFHIIGLITTIRSALMRGGRVLVSDGFEPARTLARLADETLGVTHYFCVPQMAAMLRASPGWDPARLSRLTAIFTGGAPHPEASIRAWLDDGIAIVDGYGLSEAGTVFGMPIDCQEVARRAGSVGVAPPGVEARIVDDSGFECAVGAAGELQLRGSSIACAYWRQPDVTTEAFASGGWFRTGDIARCDADGFHWIVDRKKDMFISGGENIYPAEIEASLAGHPDIVECAVVGVPDEQWGEVGRLFVVLKAGARADADTILAAFDGALARYKIPKHVRFVSALPRNGAGKVVKAHLRKIGVASPSAAEVA